MKRGPKPASVTFSEVDPNAVVAQSSSVIADPLASMKQALRDFVSNQNDKAAVAFGARSSSDPGNRSIVGYGLGKKITDGSLTGEWAIEAVLVTQKLEPRAG